MNSPHITDRIAALVCWSHVWVCWAWPSFGVWDSGVGFYGMTETCVREFLYMCCVVSDALFYYLFL